jgi:hypothetical protein
VLLLNGQLFNHGNMAEGIEGQDLTTLVRQYYHGAKTSLLLID